MKTRFLLVLFASSACRVTCGPVQAPPPIQPSAREPAIDIDREREQAQQSRAISQPGSGHVNLPTAAIAGVAGGTLIGVGVAASLGGDGGAPAPPPPSDSR